MPASGSKLLRQQEGKWKMIEIKKGGQRGVLMVKFSDAGGVPTMVLQQAQAEDIANAVAAGDPKISGRLNELGWRKVKPESKTMAEAGAELLHAARAAHRAIGLELTNAINNYTDNVAPLDDDSIVLGYRCFVALLTRKVLPGEIDEDPKPNVVLPKTQFDKLQAGISKNFEHMIQAVRALIVCLDSDTSDELQDPVKMVERLAELVRERDKAAEDAEHAMSLMLQQMGKETVARVEAQRLETTMFHGYENAHKMREKMAEELRTAEKAATYAFEKLLPFAQSENEEDLTLAEVADRCAQMISKPAMFAAAEQLEKERYAARRVDFSTPAPESLLQRAGFWTLDKLLSKTWPG